MSELTDKRAPKDFQGLRRLYIEYDEFKPEGWATVICHRQIVIGERWVILRTWLHLLQGSNGRLMPYCDECGCYRTSNGTCSGCMEELYIIENQSEWIDTPLSEEFLQEAEKQRKTRKEINENKAEVHRSRREGDEAL